MFQNRAKILLPMLVVAIAFYGAMAARLLLAPDHDSAETRFLNFAMVSFGEGEAFPEKVIVPVYPFLTAIFSGLPDRGLHALRALSLLFGIGSLLLLFRLSKKAADPLPAAILVALVAADPFFNRLSGAAQPYTLALFLGLALLSAYRSLGQKKNAFPVFIGTGALIAMTLPAGVLILFVFGLIALLMAGEGKSKHLGSAFGIWLLIPVVLWGVAFALWGTDRVLASMLMDHGMRPVQAGLFERMTGLFGPMVWTDFFSPGPRLTYVAIAVGMAKGLLILIAVMVPGKENAKGNRLAFIAFLFLVVVLGLSVFFQYARLPGAWLILTPLIWLLALSGAQSLFGRKWLYPIAALLICSIVLSAVHHHEAAGVRWKELAEKIRSLEPKNGQIVVFPMETMTDIALVLQEKNDRPIIRAKGFYNNGRYDRQDDFAAFRWTGVDNGEEDRAGLLGSVADSIPDMGRVHLILPVDSYLRPWSRNEGPNFIYKVFDDFTPIDDDYGRFNRLGFATWVRDSKGALGLDQKVIDFMKADEYKERIQGAPAPIDLDHDLFASRMNLARQYLISSMDCEKNCLPFFHHDLTKADGLSHANWDWCDISARYAVALCKIGEILGPMENGQPLERLQRSIFGTIRRDGLAFRLDTDFSDVEADLFDQGSVMLYLVDKYARTKKEMYREMIDGMIDSLIRKASPTQGGLKFAFPTVLPDGSRGPGKENWGQADPCHHGGRLLYPLALYLKQVPDSKKAKELFDGIDHYIRFEAGVFRPDGSFTGHTHSRTNTLLGLLIRAQDTRDQGMENFVKRSADWLIQKTPEWGWIPEFMPKPGDEQPENLRAETDALVDLISILLILANKEPDYWDVIDRYVQNGLLQAQFTGPWDGANSPRGAFCGFCAPNDFGERTMNCCSPAGAGMLADLYHTAVEKKPDGLLINLPIDRDGPLARIETKEETGRMKVTVRPKIKTDLMIRLPGFVKGETIRAGDNLSFVFKENPLTLSGIEPGGAATIEYALPERTEVREIGGQAFRYRWKGNRVEGVEPRAGRFPLFEQEN